MHPYSSAEWESLFLAEAGASAALAGLLFVALSINLELGLLSMADDQWPEVAIGSLVVTGVMSIWILYAQHCRQLYLFKLDRIYSSSR